MADEKDLEATHSPDGGDVDIAPPLEDQGKTTWAKLWPVIACGAGLFSDGMRLFEVSANIEC